MAGRVAYYGNIVKDGLVLDLDAAKRDSYPTTGTVWRDISGNNYTGSLTNGPTFSSTNNGSIVFDGVDDYVICGDIINYTNSFTVSSWINVNSSLNPIISKWSGTFVASRFFLFRTNSNVLQFFDSNTTLFTGGTVPSNVWTQVGFVINGSSSQLYINGTPSGNSFTPTMTVRTGVNLGLGCYSNPFDTFLTGKIAYIQVYNKALSAQEVLQNYNATKGRYGL
jgi:hypothetical protein